MTLKKILGYLSILLIAALLLSACLPGEQEEQPAFPEEGSPLPGETAVLPPTGPEEVTPEDVLGPTPADPLEFTPEATGEVPTGSPEATGAPESGGPPSSSGAIIQPESGRAELTRLSASVGFQVIDREGQTLGVANDYILNLCETHLLYIVLDAGPALRLLGGEQALIPYEIVSLHSGTLNSEERTIQLDLGLADVQPAPAMDRDAFDVTTPDWESEVQGFWTTLGNLSLTTECRVPAAATGEGEGSASTPAAGQERVSLFKNAFASEVIGATVVDGNGQPLGSVAEVLLVPESGRLTFAAVQLSAELQADQNLVLVPPGALNLQEGGEMAEGVTLVLLVDTQVLAGAPGEASLPEPGDTGRESRALDYWGEFVPLTREELP